MEFYFVEGENYVKNKRSPSAQSKKSRPSTIQTYSRPDRHSCLRNLSRTRLHSRRSHARLAPRRTRTNRVTQEVRLKIQSNHLRRLSPCRNRLPRRAVPCGTAIPPRCALGFILWEGGTIELAQKVSVVILSLSDEHSRRIST